MTALEDIKIRVETPQAAPYQAQNALPVLHQIRHALNRLVETGESTVIDLSAIPFGPGDREQLLDKLGEGEVQATVSSLGDTHIQETAYPGVWQVQYLAPTGEELAHHIEITLLPTLLSSPLEDVADAARALSNELNTEHDPA